jgi:hypothetical protein
MWLVVLLMGCDRERPIDFPPGLEPLDRDNTASWPDDQAEALDTNSGSDGDYTWAHARGYVHAPLDVVYPCLQVTEINIDRRQDTEWTVVPDVEEGYEHSYRLDILVHSLIDVAFSDTWRHGSTRDEDGAPLLTITAWQMTEGNPYMTDKRGSIVAEAVDDGVTSLDVRYEQDVSLPDEEQMKLYLEDTHAELVACADGEPLPQYSD